MRPVIIAGAVALLGLGCAHVNPEDLTAAEHQAEVARHERAAREAEAKYDPGAREVGSPRDLIWQDPLGSQPSTGPANPTERYLTAAELNRAHAREHAMAAARLNDARRRECGPEAEQTRSCPLLRGRIASVELIANGVRLQPKEGVDTEAMAKELRCYLAAAHYQGFQHGEQCLIFLPHVQASVVAGGKAIELRTTDRATVERLHQAALKTFRPRARPEGVGGSGQ